MILLELFAGIGGFSKGFEQAGCSFEQTYFSEIDKHAIANFKFNFPHKHIFPQYSFLSYINFHPLLLILQH